jgi:hypothetical protein
MKTQLRKEVGNPSTTDVTDADLGKAINDAYHDLAENYRHHNTRKFARFSTAVSVFKYALPTDCGVLRYVKNITQGWRIRKYDNTVVASLGTPTTGSPEWYSRKVDYIELYPTPNAIETLELYYNLILADLSADADVPVLLPTWHIGIIKKARWYHFDTNRMYNEATGADTSFKMWMETKVSEFDEETRADSEFGVEIVPLSAPVRPRYDFDHSD